MRALVTNWGATREFPTCIGNVHIAARETREITGDRAIQELMKFPLVDVDIKPEPKPDFRASAEDYRKLKINDLRALAARRILKASPWRMGKADLISLLEEQQHG